MGIYINRIKDQPTPLKGKAVFILANVKGSMVSRSAPEWSENLICVVTNPTFEAAAWCYSKREYMAFQDPSDPRIKLWITVPDIKELIDPTTYAAFLEDKKDGLI